MRILICLLCWRVLKRPIFDYLLCYFWTGKIIISFLIKQEFRTSGVMQVHYTYSWNSFWFPSPCSYWLTPAKPCTALFVAWWRRVMRTEQEGSPSTPTKCNLGTRCDEKQTKKLNHTLMSAPDFSIIDFTLVPCFPIILPICIKWYMQFKERKKLYGHCILKRR